MKVYELENIIKKNGAIFTSAQIEKMEAWKKGLLQQMFV